MSPDIVVVGSLNHDLTVLTRRHPRPGETVLGTGHYSDNGGKGANQAVAAARLGGRVAMIGLVGDDADGATIRRALEEAGIDVTGVGVDPDTPTGLAVITVDEEVENTIVVSPGANATLEARHVEGLGDVIGRASVVLAQLEVPQPAVTAAAHSTKGVFCLNPAPAGDLSAELLSRVDVLIPNRSELAILAGMEEPASPGEVVSAVERLNTSASVIVTLGAEGALVVEDGEVAHFGAPRVEAIDPTGAGDAFCGAVAHALCRGLELGTAVERAVVAGALATTRRGAQSAMPTGDEVERLLAN